MKSKFCPWCCEADTPETFLELGANNDLGLAFSLVRCPACRAVWVDSPPDEKQTKDYFTSPQRWKIACDPDGRPVDPGVRAASRRKEYEEYVREILGLWPSSLPKRVLDLGAGVGLMLSLFPANYELLAVEPHPEAAGIIRQKQINCLCDWAENLRFKPESFGLIILNQSLDHLLEPGLLLERLSHWLCPGGLILISGLINPESVMARIYGRYFRLWHPMHRFYLPPSTILAHLQALGFSSQKCWQPYFGTPYGSVWKMLRALPQIAAAVLGYGRQPSPAWPGNTYSILMQKTLVPLTVKKIISHKNKKVCWQSSDASRTHRDY